MCVSICRSPRSWIFWAQGVRRSQEPDSTPLPPSFLSSSSSFLHLPSSDKPHYEREKARKYPLLPPTPAAPRLWRGSGGGGGERRKKKESGAKCERGLVSMPTAGGRTYAANQAAMVPARHLFLSLLFSLPAWPPLPSPPRPSPLSVGEIRLGPAPRIKPYLSSWG